MPRKLISRRRHWTTIHSATSTHGRPRIALHLCKRSFLPAWYGHEGKQHQRIIVEASDSKRKQKAINPLLYATDDTYMLCDMVRVIRMSFIVSMLTTGHVVPRETFFCLSNNDAFPAFSSSSESSSDMNMHFSLADTLLYLQPLHLSKRLVDKISAYMSRVQATPALVSKKTTLIQRRLQ